MTHSIHTGRRRARERVAQSVRRLSAWRGRREEELRRRLAGRVEMIARLAADPLFWRATSPAQRAALLRRMNADRARLGLEPCKGLTDPRPGALAALLHRHTVDVQLGLPADDRGELEFEPFLEEAARTFGDRYLAEQNVNLHNQAALAAPAEPGKPAAEPATSAPEAAKPEATPAAEVPEKAVAPPADGTQAPLPSWRENYRRLLGRYAVKQTSREERLLQFRDLLAAWRNLHESAEVRPELRASYARALLAESAALGLGWTEAALRAYAERGAPPRSMPTARARREEAAKHAAFKLAYLGRARAHLERLLDRSVPVASREPVAAELLVALFDLEEAAAQGLAGLPPHQQLAVLRRQGALTRADCAAKTAWERMIFARMLPRGLTGVAPEVRAEYVEAARELARGTWRYFRGQGSASYNVVRSYLGKVLMPQNIPQRRT